MQNDLVQSYHNCARPIHIEVVVSIFKMQSARPIGFERSTQNEALARRTVMYVINLDLGGAACVQQAAPTPVRRWTAYVRTGACWPLRPGSGDAPTTRAKPSAASASA
jgi:hypothetical protein